MKKTKQGQRFKNPLRNNSEAKEFLTKQYGAETAKALTERDVYKYTNEDVPPIPGVVYSETRTRKADGTVSTKVNFDIRNRKN